MLKNIPITELKPYPNNPRKNDHAVDAVAASIREFGFKVPLVIDKDGVIVAGHTRYKAAQKLGLKELPCIVADDLTDDQIKAFRLADNKTAELAEWDFELLDLELDDIELDMGEFGFEDKADLFACMRDDVFVNLNSEDALTFGLTLQIPIEQRNRLEKYIANNGKSRLVDLVLTEVADASMR